MKADRAIDLCERFPIVTRDLFVFEVGDGWHLLLRHALGQLERIARRDAEAGNEPLLITRIREDHGCLEIITKGIDDEIFDIVNGAYQASGNVCEICGCAGGVEIWRRWVFAIAMWRVLLIITDNQRHTIYTANTMNKHIIYEQIR